MEESREGKVGRMCGIGREGRGGEGRGEHSTDDYFQRRPCQVWSRRISRRILQFPMQFLTVKCAPM